MDGTLNPGGASLAVVKLGGSVIDGPEAHVWNAALAELTAPAVVVPGGGGLADAVREDQKRIGFDDARAHVLALAAMDAMAARVAAMSPRFALATTLEAFRAALTANHIPVWAPSDMAAGAPGIQQTWDVTSDSLAAWLAARLGAVRLVLIKSAAATGTTPDDWSKAGLTDAAFPDFARAAGCPVTALGPGDEVRLARVCAGGTETRLASTAPERR